MIHLEEYAKGLEWGLAAVSAAPEHGTIYVIVAALYVALGEVEKGKAAMGVARRLVPRFVESRLNGYAAMRAGKFRERYLMFIRIAAGIEELNAAV